MIGYIICAAFQLQFMAHAIDIKDKHGQRNEMCHQIMLKKTKKTLYYPVIQQQKTCYALYIAKRWTMALTVDTIIKYIPS